MTDSGSERGARERHMASIPAAIWDKHPRPWRTEDDWTCEVIDASGNAVTKYALQDRWVAQLLVALVNCLDADPPHTATPG